MPMPSEHIPVAQTVKYQTENRRESFRAAAIVTQSEECGNEEERKGKDGGGQRERQGRRVGGRELHFADMILSWGQPQI